MIWPDRLRLKLSFDPARLARDLATYAEADWTQHYVPQNYEGDWGVIPLRSAAGETHPIRMIAANHTTTEFVDTRYLAGRLYLAEVIAAFACELRSVRLMRLTPGSVIKEHTDPFLDEDEGQVRLHIPILTNPDVEFLLGGVHVAMSPGSVWRLRLTERHSVANRGRTDRVHLVLDANVNDWLLTRLGEAAEAATGAMPA